MTAGRFDPRGFIASVDWRFAKTMAHYNPHWYVVERDNAGPRFTDFVAFVRSGPIRRYRGGRYHCVTVDGWDYWLTHAGDDGWIVNRKRSKEAGWDDVPPTRDKRELIWHDVERELISAERADELLRGLAAGRESLGSFMTLIAMLDEPASGVRS